MGTNYYGHIIPTKKRKLELFKLINNEDFSKVTDEINKTFGRFELDYDGKPTGGVVHLGKRSAGWKFLWNPNIYLKRNGHLETNKNSKGSYSSKWIPEPNSAFYLYPLTKKGIKNFIDREDVVIYDEYGDRQDKEEFFNTAVNWTTWIDYETRKEKEAWDSKSYTEWERSKNPNWRTYKCSGEYIELLKSEGIKFISEDNSDFYSDGLRFATNNEFS